MARAAGIRQRQVAVRLTAAEAAALDAARLLDGGEGGPAGVAAWIVAAARRTLGEHAARAGGDRAGVATAALAALDLERRLIGAAGAGNRRPVVGTDARAMLRGLQDLAERQGDAEAAALGRAALTAPTQDAPGWPIRAPGG